MSTTTVSNLLLEQVKLRLTKTSRGKKVTQYELFFKTGLKVVIETGFETGFETNLLTTWVA